MDATVQTVALLDLGGATPNRECRAPGSSRGVGPLQGWAERERAGGASRSCSVFSSRSILRPKLLTWRAAAPREDRSRWSVAPPPSPS